MLADSSLGLYVHIPFCRAKCSYCAFVSKVCDGAMQRSYVAALCGEIAAAGGDFSVPVDTIFFGGGTPTVLEPDQLTAVLQRIRSAFLLTADAEISLEANPGTVDLHALQLLRQAGFNRLSLGVQSFNERILKSIGRIHRADEAKNAFNAARAAGFENISFDLMYGLPTQSLADWHDTLQQAVDLSPDHLSAYGLKLEDGTRMELDVRAGRLALPSEDEEEAMYDLLNVFLPQQGYDRYEISNYAPNGKECQHNLKYWRYHPYRGFGVAAHSFNGQDRFANSEDISRYIETVEKCESPEEFRESLDASTAMAEYAFLALRTVNGLSETNFELRFEKKFADYYAKAVSRLLRLGLLIHEKDTWRLTERGMKLGNQAFEEFLP